MEVEKNEIVHLSKIFKEELQPTLDLNIKSNHMIKFVYQNQVEETPIVIDIIMFIHIENKKVILWGDLATNIRLFGENIERDLATHLKGLEVVRFYKTSFFHRMISKINKKMKYGEFFFKKD